GDGAPIVRPTITSRGAPRAWATSRATATPPRGSARTTGSGRAPSSARVRSRRASARPACRRSENRTVSASSSRVSSVGGGRPSDALQGGVRAVGGGEVAQADHAHGAAAAFDDGEAAHGVLPHEVGRVLGGVVGAERHQG